MTERHKYSAFHKDWIYIQQGKHVLPIVRVPENREHLVLVQTNFGGSLKTMVFSERCLRCSFTVLYAVMSFQFVSDVISLH